METLGAGGLLLTFQFDPASQGRSRASLGPTEPPFVERASGEGIVVGGGRYYQLLLEGMTQGAGDRLRSERGIIREVVEVEADGVAEGTIRWVIGFVEPSCMSLVVDARAARIDLAIGPAVP